MFLNVSVFRGIRCVFVIFTKGRVRSGIGLARLVLGRVPASSCSRGCVVHVTVFCGQGGVCQCRIGMGWHDCRWGLVCFTRHVSQETHTHHPNTRHAPRHSLLLSFCKRSLLSFPFCHVSYLLSVVCLLSLVCLVVFRPCFCPLSVLSVSARLSVPVCACVVCSCEEFYMCASFRVFNVQAQRMCMLGFEQGTV